MHTMPEVKNKHSMRREQEQFTQLEPSKKGNADHSEAWGKQELIIQRQ